MPHVRRSLGRICGEQRLHPKRVRICREVAKGGGALRLRRQADDWAGKFAFGINTPVEIGDGDIPFGVGEQQ